MSTTTSDTDLTVKSLDGFYCANIVASLWADAVGNRLEGPDCGDIRSITEAGLRELGTIIAAYEEFLVRVRDSDPVSHQLVTRLLADQTHRRADIEAALQGPSARLVEEQTRRFGE